MTVSLQKDAVEIYREILREFPGLSAADRAKARLEALRTASPKRT